MEILDHGTGELVYLPSTEEQPAYMREVATKERKSYKGLQGYETVAKRFSPKEQEQHTRIIKCDEEGEYRLFDQNNNLYDTKDEISKGERGLVAYAVDLDGKLVTSKHIRPGKGVNYGYYHSTLLGGKPGLCFGMMKVEEGKITYIDLKSGHYKPVHENLYNAFFKRSDLHKVFSQDKIITSHFIKDEKLEVAKESPNYFRRRMEVNFPLDGLTIPNRYFKALREERYSYMEKILNQRDSNIGIDLFK